MVSRAAPGATVAICGDATDIQLAADLRNPTHGFVAAASSQDVATFDNTVGALHDPMVQHVRPANTGEFGRTPVQAPHQYEPHRVRVHATATITSCSTCANPTRWPVAPIGTRR